MYILQGSTGVVVHGSVTAVNITVGYEFTLYTTNETVGEVELCAVIFQPPTGGAPRDFVISATTRNGTAGNEWCNVQLHVY